MAAVDPQLAPASTPLQREAASRRHPPVPKHCVVTGGSGFIGQRLVEMLVERGAEHVVSFDVAPKPADAWEHPAIRYVVGDLRDAREVLAACAGAECVFHLGAVVGPYHSTQLYEDVNHKGSLHVIAACKAVGCPKLVMSSSPSTRFDGGDVDGLTEAQLPQIPQRRYLQEYARTKALGELAVRAACSDQLRTVAVAPHQVYGPRDSLFLPNLLEVAAARKLRVFGSGRNRISFTHVDNYCHGLLLAERALYAGSPALGNFYVVTDGDGHTHTEGYGYFWDELDLAVVRLGFPSLRTRLALPYPLLMALAHGADMLGGCLGRQLKLSPFAVRMLTMHRWFRIDAAERDLSYVPLIGFTHGWEDTIAWFRENWLPTLDETRAAAGIAGPVAHRAQQQHAATAPLSGPAAIASSSSEMDVAQVAPNAARSDKSGQQGKLQERSVSRAGGGTSRFSVLGRLRRSAHKESVAMAEVETGEAAETFYS